LAAPRRSPALAREGASVAVAVIAIDGGQAA
jgi:hypothetical protein